MDRIKSLGVMFLCAAACLIAVGCGSGDQAAATVKKINKNNVMRLASCYAMYQQMNEYRGPKNLEEFKAFLKDPEREKLLTDMGFDFANIDATFIGERDDEAIVIRWGVPGSSRGCYEPVTFEATGVDGVKIVGFANGVFEEVDDEQTIKDMMSGKHKPGNARQESTIPKFDKNGNPID